MNNTIFIVKLDLNFDFDLEHKQGLLYNKHLNYPIVY